MITTTGKLLRHEGLILFGAKQSFGNWNLSTNACGRDLEMVGSNPPGRKALEPEGPRLQASDREELIIRSEEIMLKPDLPSKVCH